MTTPSSKISVAVLTTLSYSKHFHFPLTFSELHKRLIGVRVTPSVLRTTLHSLLQKKQIERKGPYYFLPGGSTLIKQRLLYARLSQPLRTYAQSLIKTLTVFSGVKAIYLTGSLAMSNTDGHDDIDLMIIVENGRLWTTRFLLTLYTTLLGLRRSPSSRANMGKLCLNLYLTPRAYTLPLHKQSLYSAYELIQAVPLYDPLDTRADLLAANPWIEKFLPNMRTVPKRNSRLRAEKGSPAGEGTVLKFVESFLYHFQLAYMRPKITREYVTKDSAFFHPRDPSPKI